MNRFLRILFLLVGLAVALVAGVFGLVLVAVLLVALLSVPWVVSFFL